MEFDWKIWFMDVWEDNRRLTNNVAHALEDAGAMDNVLVEGMRPFRADAGDLGYGAMECPWFGVRPMGI